LIDADEAQAAGHEARSIADELAKPQPDETIITRKTKGFVSRLSLTFSGTADLASKGEMIGEFGEQLAAWLVALSVWTEWHAAHRSNASPAGSGNTSRSSRIARRSSATGTNTASSHLPRESAAARRCARALLALPARNASGTNPSDSQKRFASMSCAHQQQNSLAPVRRAVEHRLDQRRPDQAALFSRRDVHLIDDADVVALEVLIVPDAVAGLGGGMMSMRTPKRDQPQMDTDSHGWGQAKLNGLDPPEVPAHEEVHEAKDLEGEHREDYHHEGPAQDAPTVTFRRRGRLVAERIRFHQLRILSPLYPCPSVAKVPHAASVVTPALPKVTLTGAQAGPLSMRVPIQNAVSHTVAPGASVVGNGTSSTALLVWPSNFQSSTEAGGVAPVKLNTDAPRTFAGLPRRAPVPSCSLIFTVRPATDTTSRFGGSDGAGIGDGVARTFNPSCAFCALVTVAVPSTIFAQLRMLVLRAALALFFAITFILLRTPGSTASSAVEYAEVADANAVAIAAVSP
jgi:hypothetical protein